MEATDGQKIHEVVGTRDCALDSVCSQLLWPCEVSSTHAKYRDKMFICPAYSLACVCENCAAARCVNSCFKMSFNTPWVRIPFSLYLICCWLASFVIRGRVSPQVPQQTKRKQIASFTHVKSFSHGHITHVSPSSSPGLFHE